MEPNNSPRASHHPIFSGDAVKQMSMDAFFETLKTRCSSLRWEVRPATRCIRAIAATNKACSMVMCPIVAVAWQIGQGAFRNSDFYAAASAIGLSPRDADQIVLAADLDEDYDLEIRRKLLDTMCLANWGGDRGT